MIKYSFLKFVIVLIILIFFGIGYARWQIWSNATRVQIDRHSEESLQTDIDISDWIYDSTPFDVGDERVFHRVSFFYRCTDPSARWHRLDVGPGARCRR